jgi:hypothetical protein
MKDMYRWLARYDNERLGINRDGQNKTLHSSRFNIQGLSWDEIREIPIPELGDGMTFGTSFEALRKSWYSHKKYRKDGLPAPEVCLRLLRIEKFLGLPLSQFPEIDNEWANEELSHEGLVDGYSCGLNGDGGGGLVDNSEDLSGEERALEAQLRLEERKEALADWGLDDDEVENDEVGR